MGTVILFSGVALFIGYQIGWVNGYEKKDKDDKRIEAEIDTILKGAKITWATK